MQHSHSLFSEQSFVKKCVSFSQSVGILHSPP